MTVTDKCQENASTMSGATNATAVMYCNARLGGSSIGKTKSLITRSCGRSAPPRARSEGRRCSGRSRRCWCRPCGGSHRCSTPSAGTCFPAGTPAFPAAFASSPARRRLRFYERERTVDSGETLQYSSTIRHATEAEQHCFYL